MSVCEYHHELEHEIKTQYSVIENRLNNHGNNIRTLCADVAEIKVCLVGNLEKKGLVSKVKANTDAREKKENTKNGLYDWAFRLIISIILGFIAMKVGLK